LGYGSLREMNALISAMADSLKAKKDRSRSAVFFCPGANYHADCCAPLRAAVRRGEVKLAALARRGYPGRPLPAQMLPEVSTVGFWDATGTQTWGLDWHRNEGIELMYLARGKTEFLVDKGSFLLESGHLTITRPWQRHRVGNPNVGSNRLCWLILDVGVRRPNQTWKWPDWLILAPADLRRLTTLLSHNEQPVWQANDEIGACFNRIAGLVQTSDPLAVQTRLQLHINELFVVLRELLEEKKVKLDARLTTTRRMVELFLAALPQHLEDPWTLPEMARQCGLGSSAFADYCCRITNQTPVKYLTHCRIEAARKLLASRPDLSITDVAFSCGFQSSQYLATVFRQKMGQSPRACRAARARQ
jgi:AraC family L-rhamnose operon regulatory protein RhaS